MGMVFQHFNLFPHMTLLRNMTLAPMKLLGKSKEDAEAKAMELLARVGLCRPRQCVSQPALRRPETAYRHRARAVHGARRYAFDEPTSALDPEMVGEVLDVMKRACPRGHDNGRRYPRDGLLPVRSATACCSWLTVSSLKKVRPRDIFEHPQSERFAGLPVQGALM